MPDGSVIYSGRFVYSPLKYAESAMTNTQFKDGLKALCVALMNYGAAAQAYFADTTDYTYETPMNAGFDQYQSMVRPYDSSMITDRVSNTKTIAFAFSNGYYTSAPVFGLVLEGAIDMNFTYTAAKSGTITSAGMLVWDAETYAAIDKFTTDNATVQVMADADDFSNGGKTFKLSYTGTPAKEMGDTVYVIGFYEIDGVTYYSGMVTRSIEYYANNTINGNYPENLKNTVKALVVYGDYAKNNFG